jgi:hypothetical protein
MQDSAAVELQINTHVGPIATAQKHTAAVKWRWLDLPRTRINLLLIQAPPVIRVDRQCR